MAHQLKLSRYNHFTESGNRKRLVFNAVSSGLAELDDETYETLRAFERAEENRTEQITDLLAQFRRGGFLVPKDFDELSSLRANHYYTRFGAKGLGLTLIPTLGCNFACDYCYEEARGRAEAMKQRHYMSQETCDNVISYCERHVETDSALTITWYGGEPLLARGTIEYITTRLRSICCNQRSKYIAGIITNGYLLSRQNVEFLLQMDVSFAQITLDGPQVIHDKRRPLIDGGPTYTRILDNITELNDSPSFRVSIRVNIDHRNREYIELLLDELKRRELHKRQNVSVYFSQTVHYANSCPDIAGECMASRDFAAWMVEAYMLALDFGFKISVYPSLQIGTCGAVSRASLVIEPDGSVHNCWNAVGNARLRTGVVLPV